MLRMVDCVHDNTDGAGLLTTYVAELSEELGDDVDMASVSDALLDYNLEACSQCGVYFECSELYMDEDSGQAYCPDCNPYGVEDEDLNEDNDECPEEE